MSTRSRRTFQELVTLPEGAVPLAEAALLMACEEYPQLEISPYLDTLDEIAAVVRPKLSPRISPLDTIETLNDVLFGIVGFRGNTENYNDPRNSFFNDVLERRVGIPITLSAVYLEVARRVSFPDLRRRHAGALPREVRRPRRRSSSWIPSTTDRS